MLENNLHPDVAEKPEELVVYGGIGKAARNRESYETIRRELTSLGDEETLLVQSGKPVAVFETHDRAPRVLIANSNLVPQWATWRHFQELDAAGLMMYGQMTAGSWIYIGSQGILQGTYETFAAIARKRFDGSLRGRLVVTAGLGGMGGAQPLAVTMCGGTALCIEVEVSRIERRINTGYLDERATDLDDALTRLGNAANAGRTLSVGLLGNASEILPELARRHAAVYVVTDQTSAHDPLNGYIPAGLTVEQAEQLRRSDLSSTSRGSARVPSPMSARSGSSGARARRRLTTATRCGDLRASTGTRTRSRIPASSRRTSARCSARARARSAGSPSPAIPRTSIAPMRRSSTCSVIRRAPHGGSAWPASASASRGCRPVSAGSGTGSATWRDGASTRWLRAAS